jgi:hypothetical protein
VCATLWASQTVMKSFGSCLQRGDLEIKMITAAEYRAWAEESLEFGELLQTKTRVRHTLNLLRFGLNRLYGLSASPLYLSALLKSRYLRPITSGCCPRLENGRARALHSNEKASRPISLGCQAAPPKMKVRRIAANIAKLLLGKT